MSLARVIATSTDGTKTFDLRPGEIVRVGRSSECTIQLRDSKVSREHAHLRLVEGMLHVLDQGSSHGVVHQGERCSELLLDHGETFTVGKTTLRFESLDLHAAGSGDAAGQAAVGGAPMREAARDAAPAYPIVGLEKMVGLEKIGGLEGGTGIERITRRRLAPPAKRFAARLAADGIVFAIMTVVVITLLLLLRMKSSAFDVYRLLDLFGLPKP